MLLHVQLALFLGGRASLRGSVRLVTRPAR